MIIFGVMLFGLMLAIGGLSFDLMRYEAHRSRLQATLDRAVLAAASLTQQNDAKTVVLDYMAKAGLADYINESDINVTQGLGSQKVQATAHIHVPLHHGTMAVFTGIGSDSTTLVATANSAAQESIGNIEISMVLDVSGSMGSYSRLSNLKTAAQGFLDTVYDAAEANTVSTSIIPYATQVNAGANLLSYFQRNAGHEYSHCLNFQTADFSSTTMSLVTPYDQTVHFDPWTSWSSYYTLGDTPPWPVCGDLEQEVVNRAIMPWSTNKSALKTYIGNFVASGNTSTDVGVKWGAALLDPSLQSVVDGMIGTGDVHSALTGRPFNYDTGDAMKILIVMTDGEHTSQFYMNNYREGDSFVWTTEQGGNTHYSLWWDGEASTPVTSPTGNHSYCRGSQWYYGSCYDWEWGSNPDFWFRTYGSGDDLYYSWASTPKGGANATQETWNDLWAKIPPKYFSAGPVWDMHSLTSYERNRYTNAVSYVGSSTKDTRFDTICQAVKSQNVIVFTIGLEVPNSTHEQRLENCATSTGHYYDINNLEIGFAFSSIAAQINQLRLIQ
ncbi:hypothetical protein AIOL_002963 [Candidatus Rhodobacter oscarellae]|uniref:Putative Flp pilus-assembly TadG-like N-terminal domain-containing protein n=1 Tax=Candidatus Rhodobacter oscarellae TaxID=1675527 RepID=A0A0J9E5F0_9RHOB|nr:pilus assembly protein TadG-related protein [Candidatus Rhodobacter lobularis]KMW57995.1 hypothetical protein AIOL_002963 [Candidatus Rhodobacter lobularis]